MDFDYKLITKGDIIVVSFKGRMSKESKDKILQCQSELLVSTGKTIVLFFRDVSMIDIGVLRELTQFQNEVRKSSLRFFITGLSNILKQMLDDKGVLRSQEVKGSLEEILLQAV